MRKRYDSVKFEGGFDVASGKAQVKYTLEKNGHKTVSEFYKDYGEYEMPIKFVGPKKKKKIMFLSENQKAPSLRQGLFFLPSR